MTCMIANNVTEVDSPSMFFFKYFIDLTFTPPVKF